MEKFKDIKNKINIKDIKSSFIKNRIFSFIYKKQKLDMIIYNKELQRMLSVDIKDYEKISGKYIIKEKLGKGKEYILNTNNV